MNSDGSSVTQLISNEFANPGYGGEYAVNFPTWSPDGRSIAFVRTNYEDPWTVHILDLVTSEISFLRIGSSVGNFRPVWSPDGTRLLVEVSGQAIVSVNRNGSGLQGYLEGTYLGKGTYLGNPDWSPDGRSIVFDNQWSSPGSRIRIFVQSLEDGSVRQLILDAVAPALPDYRDSQPAWSRVRQ